MPLGDVGQQVLEALQGRPLVAAQAMAPGARQKGHVASVQRHGRRVLPAQPGAALSHHVQRGAAAAGDFHVQRRGALKLKVQHGLEVQAFDDGLVRAGGGGGVHGAGAATQKTIA